MYPKTKFIIIWLLASFLLSSLGYAANEIWCTQSTAPFSNCTAKYMYLYQDNNQNTLPDYSFVPKSNYIYNVNPSKDYDLIQLMQSSSVQYYMSTWNMLYTKDANWTIWVMDNMLFRLQSFAFLYNTPIRAISAFRYVNVEVPSITWLANTTIGIKYNHVLKRAVWYDWTTTSNYRYRQVPSLDYFGENLVQSYIQNNTRRSWSSEFTNSTCVNYNIQRCWDGKTSLHTWYLQNNTFYPVLSWVNTWFVPEVCDSITTTGAACVNWSAGCCNVTCSWFGWGFCGDGIIQEEWDRIELCDDWIWDPETGQWNYSDVNLAFCSEFCEPNLEPETFPEELGQ